MQWYHYFSGFWAGMFLTNTIPHFVKGVSGDPFPTPFAKPPGQGLSTPIINVLWGLFNLIVGFLLYRAGKVSFDDTLSTIIFFAGIVLMSTFMAKRFVTKHKE